MGSLVHFPGSEANQSPEPENVQFSANRACLASLFHSIPPERVGLNGEYDHSGLAKRVSLAIRENFSAEAVASLQVSQRGRVVIFTGKVPNRQLLLNLMRVALTVQGADAVETNGVMLLERPEPANVDAGSDRPTGSYFHAC